MYMLPQLIRNSYEDSDNNSWEDASGLPKKMVADYEKVHKNIKNK